MAADDFQNLGAVDIPNHESSAFDELGAVDPDAQQQAEASTALESYLRGGAQSVTFGFADELAGAGEAVGDVAFSKKAKLANLLDLYRQHRDESRKNFEKAEEENPASYLAGELTGALVPGIGMAGEAVKGVTAAARLGKALKTGAAFGAATGLGQSTADTTQGEMSDSLKDALRGAIVGSTVGGVLSPLESIASSVGGTRFVQEPIEAFKRGFAGQKLMGREATAAIEAQQAAASKALIEDVAAGSKAATEQKSALLNEMENKGTTFDIGSELNKAQTEAMNLPNMTTPEIGDVRKYNQFLGRISDKYGASLPEKKEMVKSAMDAGIMPWGEDGDMSQEFKDFADAHLRVLRATQPVEIGPNEIERLRKSTSTLTDMGDKSLYTPEAKKSALGLSKGLQEKLYSDSLLGEPVRQATRAQKMWYDVQDMLFGNKITRDLTNVEMSQLQSAIKNKAIDLESKGKIGTKMRDLFTEAFDALEKINPEIAKRHKEQLLDVATAYDLNKAIESLGIGGGISGHGLKIGGAYSLGSFSGDVARGSIEPVKDFAQKTASWIKGSSPESLKTLVDNISNMAADAVPAGLKEKLAAAAERPTEMGRNAVLYTLLQQPSYRQFLTGFMDK